jgi:hypothetical protein
MGRIKDNLTQVGERIEKALSDLHERLELVEDFIDDLPDWTPAPVPDPEPDPEPDPSPTGLTAPRLWIWREGSSADDFGRGQSVVCAPAGRAGAFDVRIIYRAGERRTDLNLMVQRTISAKTAGCSAVVVDLESYFIREGPRHAADVYKACSKHLPFYYAPKVFLDHFKRHWNMEFPASVEFMNQYSDGMIGWYYGESSASRWLDVIGDLIDHGYTKHIVPLGDFAQRTSGGQLTSPFTADSIAEFRLHGHSVGVFMPSKNNWPSYVLKSPAWNEAKKFYG